MADGKEMTIANIDQGLISQVKADGEKKGAPLIGLKSVILASNFGIESAGRIRAIAKIDDEDIVFATLNVQS
jgi:hypothetical protein